MSILSFTSLSLFLPQCYDDLYGFNKGSIAFNRAVSSLPDVASASAEEIECQAYCHEHEYHE